MHYVSVEGLTKSFGINPLFDHISFNLQEGDKIALVARNGSGKSTLLKILAGQETPDEGKIWIHKDIRVAYLEQAPQFLGERTVIENIFDHDHPVLNTIKNYETLAGPGQTATGPELNEAIHQMDLLNGWDFEARVRQILGKLNINYLQQPVSTLSGGQRKRLALAKLLIDAGFEHHHSLLILDEPTNHLDVRMIEWLEHYLSAERSTLLVVTHDRYFLDRVCREILELEHGKLYLHTGDYARFLEDKSVREEAEKSSTGKARNLLKKEQEWMRRQPKARTSKAKSRIEAFHELKKKASGPDKEGQLDLQVKMSRLGGKVIELKKVYKSFGDTLILKGFDYTFKKGERIGIIGENGTGKTTFLNLITGKEKADSGKINTGETVVFGNYSQDGLIYKEDQRIIEYVANIAEYFPLADGTKLSASEFLSLFLFPPEQQYTYLSSLSGGEKRRLQLLTILFRNPNFLLMDEPTNDLDLQTTDILDAFLSQYQGCLLIVSHDRYFMDRLVDHLFVFEGGGVIRDFPGNYSQYREILKKEAGQKSPPLSTPQPSTLPPDNPQPGRDIDSKKLSYREKRELDGLEQEIGSLETEKKEAESRLASGDLPFETLQPLSQRLVEIINLLDKKSTRWLELSEKG